MESVREHLSILGSTAIVLLAGCYGPYVDYEVREPFRRQDYRGVTVIPFERRGSVSADVEKLVRGYLELELLQEGFRIVSWSEVEEVVRDRVVNAELGRRDTVLDVCRDKGIAGLWNGRLREQKTAEGETRITFVLRLSDTSTAEWVLELRGHDEIDADADNGAIRRAWRDLVAEAVSNMP